MECFGVRAPAGAVAEAGGSRLSGVMGTWVEFASIKERVPLMRVLEQYQIGGLRRSGKDQWRGRCPLHRRLALSCAGLSERQGGHAASPVVSEGREAFHVNTAQQLFHCFSCGAGGTVLDLVAALEHCGVREAAEKLAVGWGVSSRSAGQAVAPPQRGNGYEKREGLRPLPFRLRGVDGRHPYVSARGISERTAAAFGIGFYAGPGLLS